MNKQEILKIIAKYKIDHAKQYGIIEMGIFGSIAHDRFNTESDVDVFVTTTTPNPYFLVEIKTDLEKLLNRKVDIVRYRDNMNSFLKNHILNEGVYV